MRALDCNVVNCVYNGENHCQKDGVHVDGRYATEAKETCCGSFRQKDSDCADSKRGHCCK